MPRELPEIAADVYEEAGRDASRTIPRAEKKRSWWAWATPLLLYFARGDRSTFRRTDQEKRKLMQDLLKYLQPWKGPRARELKKELREAVIPGPQENQGGGGGRP